MKRDGVRARKARRSGLDAGVLVAASLSSVASRDVTFGRARPCHEYDVIARNASDRNSVVFNALVAIGSFEEFD